MQNKLEVHTLKHKAAVKGQDLISMGLGILAGGLLVVSICQPKNPINGLRLGLGLSFGIGSVLAERFREEHLESLQNAIGYQKSIESERIKRDTFHLNTIRDLQEEVDVFNSVPRHLWNNLAQKLGIAPPMQEERETEYYPEREREPEVDTGRSNVALEDPSQGYDPEGEVSERESSGSSVIFAKRVPEWFEANEEIIPESLVNEWSKNPGYAIEINQGKVVIMRSENA